MALFDFLSTAATTRLLSKLKTHLAGYLKTSELNQAVDDALAQAKQSGEFDGKDGAQGPQGPQGPAYTLTTTDKEAIAEAVVESGVMPYIVGNGTTTGAWTGTSDRVTAYTEGLTILFKINVAGISGGSTLDINGLGAIPVKRNASTAVTTIYPVGSVIMLTYSEGAWLTADYDANTKNSAGTSNKAATKMYLVGATSQTSSGTTTYTNTKVYIGTDNRLYSNGEVVPTISEVIAALPVYNGEVTNE